MPAPASGAASGCRLAIAAGCDNITAHRAD
jgi:hypothetical protein